MSRRAIFWSVLRDGLIASGMIGTFVAALMWGTAAI